MSQKNLRRSCAASIPFYCVGYSLLLVVYALPFWVTYDPEDDPNSLNHAIAYRYGLFFYCGENEYGCHLVDDTNLTSPWWKAIQGLFTIAAICGVVSGTTYPRMPVNGFFQILAAVSALAATVTFAVLLDPLPGQSISWCFPVAIVAAGLLLIGGLVLVIARMCNDCSGEKIFFWVSSKK